MFSEPTLFGILLLLAISFTLIFLLIRKPHLRFLGTPVERGRAERKPRKDKEARQTPKNRPLQLRHHSKSPETRQTPQEFPGSAETIESQSGFQTLSEPIDREEKSQKSKKTTSTVPLVETLEESSEPAEPPRGVQEEPVEPPSRRPQLRPSNCNHFFGYLRKIPKNATVPDECFSCPKMVECIRHKVISD